MIKNSVRGPTAPVLLALMLVVILLSACGSSGDPGTASPGTATPSSQGGSYPVQVDNCGRTLTFDEAPSRAVLPYHPMAEIFVGLGLADRAIGRVGYELSLIHISEPTRPY